MEKKQTSVFENGLIWFGAAVSIAEILTGTYFAELGFYKGLLAIITGHIIGCVMLFLAGLIGAKVRKSSMETAKMSFGNYGGLLFSILNIIQLLGWTAIMIYDGGLAANGIWNIGSFVWCLIIGILIILWILIGLKNLGKINTVAMACLFVLTIVLGFFIFRSTPNGNIANEGMSFGAAVELSVAMPLSWLPLISDYTKDAQKPVLTTAVSALTYGIVSCFMYVIGMGAAIFTQEYDISQIIIKSGLGISGLLIIVFSTVTTTFLDAHSAGVSSESITKKIKGKWIAIAVVIIGTIGAIFLPLHDITDFLYFIGSVFAPMIAIQIADFFILQKESSEKSFDLTNLIIWLIGFIIYRLLMKVDIILGSTLPDMIITILICIVVNKIKRRIKNA